MNTQPTDMFSEISTELLYQWGLRNPEQAKQHLQAIAATEIPPDALKQLSVRLADCLPSANDPDRALADFATFVSRVAATKVVAHLLQSAEHVLINLVAIFVTSQQLSSYLVQDPEIFRFLVEESHPAHEESLWIEQIATAMESGQKEDLKMTSLLGHRKIVELVRIAYGELVLQHRLEVVAEKLTDLCDSILEAMTRYVRNKYEEQWGIPRGPNGIPSQFSIIGLGKLGGQGMSYSNDLEAICIYDADGKTDGARSQSNQHFFEAVAADVEKLLRESSSEEAIYRIDYRLRPAGAPLVMTMEDACRHYDLTGRTWERQAFVKARVVAGDMELGEQFLARMASWVYRRYLSVAEITEIKALKRRIEQLSRTAGEETLDVEKGRGGIRDIEFVIQFLQLLNGGDLPSVRTPNTLQAIERLATAGCLSNQEQALLSENYRFLCRLEHRLQMTFGMQTHRLPREGTERKNLVNQMSDLPKQGGNAEFNFKQTYTKITEENRRVLNHLLHDAFADENPPSPEVDLILDPDPAPEQIVEVLKQYGFKDPAHAYRNLMELTRESVPFLSTRRCRYFLATIARDLLNELSHFPDPDSTLVNLCRTSDSLGGKGVLWELFSSNRPSLKLYINLCATSPYLSNTLIRNPGMVDELMDGLMLEKLPDFEQQEMVLSELCRGAEDIDPIIQSFNNSQILRVGVRDIVGKERLGATSRVLSDIADTCLRQWARVEYSELVKRRGEPVIAMGPRAGHIAEFVVLALGRYGGRELGYGSDLQITFLFEADGGTQHRRSERKSQQVTSNQHFFGELSQRIIKRAGQRGPYGRLYGIDMPLRSANQGTSLAISLSGLQESFLGEEVSLRERFALCRARVVLGNEIIHNQVMDAVHHIVYEGGWRSPDTEEMFCLREQLETKVPPEDIHAGRGGLVDIEFIVQVLQLCYATSQPTLRQPNTMAALLSLREQGLLEEHEYEVLAQNYHLFRSIETRLQWMEEIPSTILPGGDRLTKLALMLKYADADTLQQDIQEARQQNRLLFERLLRCTAATS